MIKIKIVTKIFGGMKEKITIKMMIIFNRMLFGIKTINHRVYPKTILINNKSIVNNNNHHRINIINVILLWE